MSIGRFSCMSWLNQQSTSSHVSLHIHCNMLLPLAQERLNAVESEKDELERRVEELTTENEALMWESVKENSPEPRCRTYVKDDFNRGKS